MSDFQGGKWGEKEMGVGSKRNPCDGTILSLTMVVDTIHTCDKTAETYTHTHLNTHTSTCKTGKN